MTLDGWPVPEAPTDGAVVTSVVGLVAVAWALVRLGKYLKAGLAAE